MTSSKFPELSPHKQRQALAALLDLQSAERGDPPPAPIAEDSEVLLGYRNWELVPTVDPSGVLSLALTSLTIGTYWETATMEARCHNSSSVFPQEADLCEAHLSWSACRCGIYAWREPEQANHWFTGPIGVGGRPNSILSVTGTVVLWGVVVEHESGYRAQNARIESLTVRSIEPTPREGSAIARLLQRRYGVPVEWEHRPELARREGGRAHYLFQQGVVYGTAPMGIPASQTPLPMGMPPGIGSGPWPQPGIGSGPWPQPGTFTTTATNPTLLSQPHRLGPPVPPPSIRNSKLRGWLRK